MRGLFILMCGLMLLFVMSNSQAFQTLFYLSTHPYDPISPQAQYQNFYHHADLVNVIAPRWFVLDAQGNLNGSVNNELLAVAQQKHVKVMPYIVNLNSRFDFSQSILHQFLSNPIAKKNTINSMVELCKQYHLHGFQFDFENIHISDKDRYSQFIADAAAALHQHNCLLSLTAMPRMSDEPKNERERQAFINWLGAYDFKKLGKYADFISVMTYNRNDAGTTPGPNAPLVWTESVVQYLLKQMPAQKISVGLIVFSNYWYMDDMHYKGGKRVKSTALEYSRTANLLTKWHSNPIWDADCGCYIAMHSQHGFYDYLFVEDVSAFKAKLALIKRYNLLGFSLFRIGYEDPRIWDVLINS